MAWRLLNRQIGKAFHRYFDDPEKCFLAILADTYAHKLAETRLGLPPNEVKMGTMGYLPKALERCMNANLRKAFRRGGKIVAADSPRKSITSHTSRGEGKRASNLQALIGGPFSQRQGCRHAASPKKTLDG